MKLRIMDDDAYVAEGGGYCPFCRSKNTCATEQIQGDGSGATCHVECHDCGETWYDHFALVGYMPEDRVAAERKRRIERNAVYQCQDCGTRWCEDELLPIEDLEDRVLPGEIVPYGECPHCGALCHLKSTS